MTGRRRSAYSAGTYSVRTSGTNSYTIGIPPHIGSELVDTDVVFQAVWHEEGILLKRINDPGNPLLLPDWLRKKEEA